ncbi:anthranilate phosphoribosyltransferase [Rhodobium orientis]|uniref:Glycosyl transferase n=1 Tax=Rhodobium orientis TaxID=34017 RepID=A0A327JLN8_9HYPH|nr:glycosyl transferase family protein [Rhodobium orientis]MBB4301908.1 anthranilate phosphoribosyltransferase [Rhodobium orientis]MBK5950146.1 glycosyl transferase [Rhodobium orientis]RAI27217.1 glycosyl transferase [Rhodobium orientis]
MTPEPHPFSRFVAILGRGKTLTRSLTVDEAEEAMSMIIEGRVLPEQVGAFLMLLRVKEESPEEIAGFVRAVRSHVAIPAGAPKVDLDWSSYAGKRRQLPWFVLSAMLLARSGIKVFMHGTEGHTAGRLYTRETLEQLGLSIAGSFDEAAAQLAATNFSYMPLEVISPKLKHLIELRPVLGLRSPVHTLSRMVNPFKAPATIQGIFHPGYMDIHRGAAKVLGEPNMAVFRGEGGEVERRPNKPCEVWTVHDGVAGEEVWPPLLPEPRQGADEDMDISRLTALWRGEFADDYAEAAVTGTVALALKVMRRAGSIEEAQGAAEAMWKARDTAGFPAVA